MSSSASFSRQHAPQQNGTYHIEDNATSLLFLESMYEQYRKSPETLSEQWQAFFAGLDQQEQPDLTEPVRPQQKPFTIFNPPSINEGGLRRPQRLEVAGRQERHSNQGMNTLSSPENIPPLLRSISLK